MSMECPICSEEDLINEIHHINDTSNTKVLQCKRCDFEFLNTWNDVKFVKSLYEGDKYVFKHNVSDDTSVGLKYDEYEVRYQWLKPFFEKSSRVLEIGCGDGKFLKKIKNDVAAADGLELSPPQVKKLRAEGFKCYDVMINEMEPPESYDIICMFAVLEHIPLVRDFLNTLKDYMHENTMVFIEVPNLNDPLISGVDIGQFRDFYYRQIHLYYFTPDSLGKLLKQEGYNFELHTSQQASITNHFHWMHQKCGQVNGNLMTSVVPPVDIYDHLQMREILEKTDNYYRNLLIQNDMGDLLSARAWLSNSKQK
jgi:2-polyprenyl-3-methyl-5-hydroxy-6-metoxy-1,4-benzoquinol methylase